MELLRTDCLHRVLLKITSRIITRGLLFCAWCSYIIISTLPHALRATLMAASHHLELVYILGFSTRHLDWLKYSITATIRKKISTIFDTTFHRLSSSFQPLFAQTKHYYYTSNNSDTIWRRSTSICAQIRLSYNNRIDQTPTKDCLNPQLYFLIAHFLAPTKDTNLMFNCSHKGGRKWRKQLIKLDAYRR